MPRTALAAVHDGRGDKLAIREIQVADPGPGEVLVRIAASGVCGSDRHVLDGEWTLPTPTVMGHEGAGIVEAVGSGVTDVAPGDSVILSWYYPCRRCRACAAGKAWACTGTRSNECLLPDGTTRLRDAAGVVYPYLAVGTMSEYTVVPESAAIRVPADVPMDVASLIGCSITTGVGAVVNNARVPAGASAAVVGCGGVGLAVVMGLALAGAYPIVAVDTAEEKLAAARSFGATHTVRSQGDAAQVAAEVAEITSGGADYAFEVIGRVETIESLPSLLTTGGVGVLVGLPPQGVKAGIDVLELAESGKTLIGSNYGGAVPSLDFPRLAGLYLAGRLPLDSLISHRVRLEEVNEAFDAMRAGTRTRSVIVFE
ncbi:S-(hydroxymethyl)glutathione dehydrogenase/alcohol dehydrogenase [Thermocatellispora tengchongensis]|uniref:S-(Hydroxymethyl)glutathione dehydrogenase/alcohol dehydrogenase n=1 Tax=Thermocatellispora tengchongensis TaxID=1073253 RepID=A0A840PSV5_9ACTN|nr:Zn-dependent alcohol dehydrogenase [Thermocatellispora tengchongensis]MBB5140217.1 S-(hydroxymethyl)glutathione dehydrogenase/alcohol dehydrogenase [Thermocatellispora tengchongensis]